MASRCCPLCADADGERSRTESISSYQSGIDLCRVYSRCGFGKRSPRSPPRRWRAFHGGSMSEKAIITKGEALTAELIFKTIRTNYKAIEEAERALRRIVPYPENGAMYQALYTGDQTFKAALADEEIQIV